MITKDFTDANGVTFKDAIWKCQNVQATEDEALAKCFIYTSDGKSAVGRFNFTFKPSSGIDYHTQANETLKDLL